jgi:hypothetical protein
MLILAGENMKETDIKKKDPGPQASMDQSQRHIAVHEDIWLARRTGTAEAPLEGTETRESTDTAVCGPRDSHTAWHEDMHVKSRLRVEVNTTTSEKDRRQYGFEEGSGSGNSDLF